MRPLNDDKLIQKLKHTTMSWLGAHQFHCRSSPIGPFRRIRNGQIHLVELQPNSRGGSYTVNLGFHYDFIPNLYHTLPGESRDVSSPWASFLFARVNAVIGDIPMWLPMGIDPDAEVKQLCSILDRVLSFFDTIGDEWRDPRVFVNMELDAILMLIAQEKWKAIPDKIHSLQGLSFDGIRLAYALACIAQKYHQSDRLLHYVKIGTRLIQSNVMNANKSSFIASFEAILPPPAPAV